MSLQANRPKPYRIHTFFLADCMPVPPFPEKHPDPRWAAYGSTGEVACTAFPVFSLTCTDSRAMSMSWKGIRKHTLGEPTHETTVEYPPPTFNLIAVLLAVAFAGPVWAQTITAPGLVGQPACAGPGETDNPLSGSVSSITASSANIAGNAYSNLYGAGRGWRTDEFSHSIPCQERQDGRVSLYRRRWHQIFRQS